VSARAIGTLTAIALLCTATLAADAAAQAVGPDPAAVRRAARAAGLASLRRVPVTDPSGLERLLHPGDEARRAAIQLGKALFWDMQVGSDGQACASCHFHAGADSRTKNQLDPGAQATDPARRHVFAALTSGGGPNHDLGPDDFPFHRLEDELARTSPVLRDADDVCSSQGVYRATFQAVVRGEAEEMASRSADPVFNVGGANVRRVGSRNTPSVINAVFNHVSFWDGRAHHLFNGVNGRGPLDAGARILVVENGRLVPRALRLEGASLASQAVEPPRNDLEMAFANRPFPALARKLLALRPLGRQRVHPRDGVLGPLARTRTEEGLPGLAVGYGELVERAFRPAYWDWKEPVDGYTLMERNFSLFFGVAIQLYESTLVSDHTPFDAFMDGDDAALDVAQMEGLLVFLNRGRDRSDDPIFARVRRGNCVSCHGGPALTNAALGRPAGADRPPAAIALQDVVALDDGYLTIGAATALRDQGFSNIGVRPTAEDLGRGGAVGGLPLSFVRQRLLGLDAAPPLPPCGGRGQEPCPAAARTAVDGAFKIPGLRNVELTGPYFHNGGQATLRQVMVFYQRLGDFSDGNVADLDPELTRIHLVEPDKVLLVDFLLALTDDRVRDEEAPFDHPQLFVPRGHPGDAAALRCPSGGKGCDDLLEIPPVGERGRRAAGLAPLGTFLGLDPHA
jgi:cytochrome c peroxidase